MVTPIASRNAVRRWGAGTAAVARALIAADDPLTGMAIAKTVGVSQPRVSQVLKHFAEQDAVQATDDGYVGRSSTLLDLYWRRSRPLLLRPESFWYSIRPMSDQAALLVRRALDARVDVAFSADIAPDLLVPWRHPTHSVVYASAALQLDDAGFVPAEGRADASIIIRWTRDSTLLAPAPPWPSVADGVPVTDPVQQWWDLLDLGGEDRREAADRLRQAILDRELPRQR